MFVSYNQNNRRLDHVEYRYWSFYSKFGLGPVILNNNNLDYSNFFNKVQQK